MNAAASPDEQALRAAEQAYVDFVVASSPETATFLGIHSNDTALDERSIPAEKQRVERESRMLTELRTRFAKPEWSPAAEIDYALLVSALTVDIRTSEQLRPLELRPDKYTEPMQAIFLMSSREYAPAKDRAAAALARIELIPSAVRHAKQNLSSPPRIATEVALDAARSADTFFEEQRPFLESALPAAKPRIAAAIAAAKRAYRDYAVFLERLLPSATGQFAVGRDYFDFMLRHRYFLQEDADAVLAIGERVFAETESKLSELARRLDPTAKEWFAVTAKVKAKHPTAETLLPTFRAEVARARAFVVSRDVVPLPPGEQCIVAETPAFERSTLGASYDRAPPFDTNVTRGFFFVTPVDGTLSRDAAEQLLRENNFADEVNTAIHETYPGHHVQLSFARLHPSLIRKVSYASIFAEGWAFYAEELFHELGYYTDEQRLMQLEWTLVRAARVLIDVGLHTRGMTFEQAVALLMDRVHLERQLAETEVKRYTMEPTQPLSYLIGRQEIFRLRERYRARAGAGFSLKAFHADLLSHGSIPPSVIEREMFGSR